MTRSGHGALVIINQRRAHRTICKHSKKEGVAVRATPFATTILRFLAARVADRGRAEVAEERIEEVDARIARGGVGATARRALDPAVDPVILMYINRLSDLLFVLARTANARGGAVETAW